MISNWFSGFLDSRDAIGMPDDLRCASISSAGCKNPFSSNLWVTVKDMIKYLKSQNAMFRSHKDPEKQAQNMSLPCCDLF